MLPVRSVQPFPRTVRGWVPLGGFCTFLASPRRRKLRLFRPHICVRAHSLRYGSSPHTARLRWACAGYPTQKNAGKGRYPLCQPPVLSRVPAIQRRRPNLAYTGTQAPTAVRRHVLHIVRICLTANAHSFHRSASPQPAHVVGPGRGPRAWQGPQSAPGPVRCGKPLARVDLRARRRHIAAVALRKATCGPHCPHWSFFPSRPQAASRGDTSNKGGRSPPCAWSVGVVLRRGNTKSPS